MNSNFNLEIIIITGAEVTFEPMFTGLRDICELWKMWTLKQNSGEKMCEVGSQKFGSRNLFINIVNFSYNQWAMAHKFPHCQIVLLYWIK